MIKPLQFRRRAGTGLYGMTVKYEACPKPEPDDDALQKWVDEAWLIGLHSLPKDLKKRHFRELFVAYEKQIRENMRPPE